jgi:hypothetical protein
LRGFERLKICAIVDKSQIVIGSAKWRAKLIKIEVNGVARSGQKCCLFDDNGTLKSHASRFSTVSGVLR